jgi:hypothetical protein
MSAGETALNRSTEFDQLIRGVLKRMQRKSSGIVMTIMSPFEAAAIAP